MEVKFFITIDEYSETTEQFNTSWVEITNQVEVGARTIERLAEELDYGNLVISYAKREVEFPMFGMVRIEVWQDGVKEKETVMYIAEDKVEPISKEITPPIYRHELSLIELTAKLDTLYINGLSFTNPITSPHSAPFTHLYRVTHQTTDPEQNRVSVYLPKANLANSYYQEPIIVNFNGGNAIVRVLDGIFGKAISDTSVPMSLFLDGVLLTPNLQPSINPNYNIGTPSVGSHYLDYGGTFTYLDETFTERQVVRFIRMYFTVQAKPQYTMFDVVNAIRNATPVETVGRLSATRTFNIPIEFENELKSIKAPQMWLYRISVREAMNLVFRYLNGISRLRYNGIGGNKILDIDKFNQKKDEFSIFNYSHFETNQAIQDYMTSGRTFTDQVVNSNLEGAPSIRELGINATYGLRSETMQFRIEDVKLETEFPIYDIKKAIARIRIGLGYGNDGALAENKVFDIDITPRVVELSIFRQAEPTQIAPTGLTLRTLLRGDTFENPDGMFTRHRQVDLVPYVFNQRNVDISKIVSSTFATSSVMYFVINQAILETKVFLIGTSKDVGVNKHIFDYRAFGGTMLKYSTNPPSALEAIEITQPNDIIKEVSFRLEYSTLGRSLIDSEREDTNLIYKDATRNQNQGERISNFERVANSNSGLVQRSGVETQNFNKVFLDVKELHKVGDFTEDKTITVAETVYQKDYLIGKYEIARDFNRKSQFVNVDRAYRPFPIGRVEESIVRHDLYKEYCEFWTTDTLPTSWSGDTMFDTTFQRLVIDTITAKNTSTANAKPLSMALVKTNPMNADNFKSRLGADLGIFPSHWALLLPVNAQGGKGALNFTFGFNDNITHGSYVVQRGTQYWQRYIKYTEDDGTFDWMHYTLLGGLMDNQVNAWDNQSRFDSTRMLPLVADEDIGGYFSNMFADKYVNATYSENNAIYVNKDTNSIYKHTYQISFVPRYPSKVNEVVVGRAFYERNFSLLGRSLKTRKLIMYHDATIDVKYNRMEDEKVKRQGTFTEVTLTNQVTTTDFGIRIQDGSFVSGTKSWAVFDENDNLIIACNTNKKGIAFRGKHFRSGVQYDW
jgi:hypothetical protein